MARGAADALGHVNAVIEIDKIGQRVHARPGERLVVAVAARTGSSIDAFVQICEWQVMQVCVGGTPAKDDFSTEVWQ